MSDPSRPSQPPRLLLALTALALLGSGCAYAKNRTMDLIDPFGCGIGVGFLASARATHFVQVGLGADMTTEKHRFSGRRTRVGSPAMEVGLAPLWFQRGTDFGERGIVLGETFMLNRNTHDDAKNQQALEPIRGRSYLPDRKAFDEGYDRRLFDVGVSAYCLVGFDLDFNPFELLDFVLGFFGLDIAGDDEAKEREPAGAQSASCLTSGGSGRASSRGVESPSAKGRNCCSLAAFPVKVVRLRPQPALNLWTGHGHWIAHG